MLLDKPSVQKLNKAISEDIPHMQVKITFEEFRVQPPVLGDCKFDKMFVVAGGNQLPVFCGANDGQV